jgi:transposase
VNKTSIATDTMDRFIGFDLSDRKGWCVTLDAHGEVIEEASVTMTPKAIQEHFGSRQPCRIAIEAGAHSPWVSRSLEAASYEVFVANPRQIPLIFRTNRKSDRLDALSLARLARLDPQLLHPMQHRSASAQQDLAVLRARDALVRSRTALINHVRGSIKAFGYRLPSCSAAAFASRVAEHIPEELKPALQPLVETIAGLTERLDAYDRQVEDLARTRYREATGLRQVAGVGPLISLAFVLTLEQPQRFRRSRDVAAFLGLTPRQRQSGASNPQMHITKAGDAFMRRLLVQGAQYILGPFGPDCDMRRWGMKLAAAGKAKKRAVTAVARKLAVLLHRLWMTGEVYEPLRGGSSAA